MEGLSCKLNEMILIILIMSIEFRLYNVIEELKPDRDIGGVNGLVLDGTYISSCET